MKKILILSVNPKNTDKLRLDEEVREIQIALKLAIHRAGFEIVTQSALRVDDLRRALLEHQPTIVHFSGHGAGNHGLVLENNSGQIQLVSTESLARLFKSFQEHIECVLLNACYSETQAVAIHQYINCVIGMNQPIGDKAAIKFAVGFYDALGAGKSYEACFELGCASLDLEGIAESETPVLKARQRLNSNTENMELKKNPVNNAVMSEEKPSQSMSISGGQFSGVQIGQAGRNLTQTQQHQGKAEKQLTSVDVVKLLTKLEELLKQSALPETQKQKATKHLETAKEEAKEVEPDKEYAAKSLQKATKLLKDAGETVDAGQGLWNKAEPIVTNLLPWLGVTADFFGIELT